MIKEEYKHNRIYTNVVEHIKKDENYGNF